MTDLPAADDGLTAWQRAGGFPFDEWHAVLMWAIGKHVAAVVARSAYTPMERIAEKGFEKAEGLKHADESWNRIFRGVLAGDPTIFDEAWGLWLKETGQLNAP